ncbi:MULTISPECIES: P27 family phage terminase small subunit [Clostridium]|uniref:Phage terminase small subunit P27 family n=1 Tax=Clostridium cadaveris TaxID=1529 RepID=A0A316MSN9_9CLOT|nr:P27 family phage terminase small subunit [Clostridium cadaveris]MDU4952965.1 P27 family phage terminase small subunit [Clostridium sp.]PWL55430.1 MAG: phage terminase small subunit P27 family [Clostridium cadaveris]
MGRPCKSAKVLTECSQTKDEINERNENEEKLKGKADNISPTQDLNDNQLSIFNFIKNELEESKLLGNLDSFILTTCVIAIDRLQYIEEKINDKPNLIFNKDLMNSKKVYTGDFLRCCNELSLSPQSRAKLANLNLNAKQDKEDDALNTIRRKKHGYKGE